MGKRKRLRKIREQRERRALAEVTSDEAALCLIGNPEVLERVWQDSNGKWVVYTTSGVSFIVSERFGRELAEVVKGKQIRQLEEEVRELTEVLKSAIYLFGDHDEAIVKIQQKLVAKSAELLEAVGDKRKEVEVKRVQGGAIEQAKGKTIRGISLDESKCTLVLAGGNLVIEDKMRNCCESRWISTEDPLETFTGAQLLEVSLGDCVAGEPESNDVQDVQFVHVYTSKGTFTLNSYNEHNGYYGGFDLECQFLPEGMEA